MSEFPSSFTEDIKIEQSAKGARAKVHVFGNKPDDTMDKTILLYKQTLTNLKEDGSADAPIEPKTDGKS